jgi:hypothetical protein
MRNITGSPRSATLLETQQGRPHASGDLKKLIDAHGQCLLEFEKFAETNPEAAKEALQMQKEENLASWGDTPSDIIMSFNKDANTGFRLLQRADKLAAKANELARTTHQNPPKFAELKVTTKSLEDDMALTDREFATANTNIEKTLDKLPRHLAPLVIGIVQWVNELGVNRRTEQVQLLNLIHGLLLDQLPYAKPV